MLIISSKEQVQEYYNSPALSQSQLKLLLGGLSNFKANQENESKLYYEEKGHFIIGGAVDTILTGNEEDFKDKYYVSTLNRKPSDTVKSIINMVYDKVVENYMESINSFSLSPEYTFEAYIADNGDSLKEYREMLITSIELHNYQPIWKMETKVSKIIEESDTYFKDLIESYGKQILSFEEKELIDSIVNSLKTNPKTSNYFDRIAHKSQDNSNIDVYYQMPIYFKYEDLDCKALLDLVIVVNDIYKVPQIVIPIDLKTMTGSTLGFDMSLRARRYDIQGVWYTIALKSMFTEANIENFRFIVESTSNIGEPLVYKLSDTLMQIGLIGRPSLKLIDTDFFKSNPEDRLSEIIVSSEIKGIQQLLDDYKWYQENGWDRERIIVENDSEILTINWNGIVVDK